VHVPPTTPTVTVPSLTTVASWPSPVHPESRTPFVPDAPVNSTKLGHAQVQLPLHVNAALVLATA
jgi:hypothetical protein